jgi:hypothetical protein
LANSVSHPIWRNKGPDKAIKLNVVRALSLSKNKAYRIMATLNFIFGDQLNPFHSWFTQTDSKLIYTLMEIGRAANYALHHPQ